MAAATFPSFAQRASEQLLVRAAAMEKNDKPSPLIQELANRIISENLPEAQTEISFARGQERIIVRFSREGDVLKYSRSGGEQIVDFDRTPQFFDKLENPLSKYTWTVETRSTDAEPSENFTITLPKSAGKTAAYAVGALGSLFYIGFINIGLGLAAAASVNKLTEAKIPSKVVVGGGAAIAAATAMLGPVGFLVGTAGVTYLIKNQEETTKMVKNAEKILKEVAPEVKKFGQAVMEKAKISIQETNPKPI